MDMPLGQGYSLRLSIDSTGCFEVLRRYEQQTSDVLEKWQLVSSYLVDRLEEEVKNSLAKHQREKDKELVRKLYSLAMIHLEEKYTNDVIYLLR